MELETWARNFDLVPSDDGWFSLWYRMEYINSFQSVVDLSIILENANRHHPRKSDTVQLSDNAARAAYNAFCENGDVNCVVLWEELTDVQREVWARIAKRLLDAINAETTGDVAAAGENSEVESLNLYTRIGHSRPKFVATVRPIPIFDTPREVVIFGTRHFLRRGEGNIYDEILPVVVAVTTPE